MDILPQILNFQEVLLNKHPSFLSSSNSPLGIKLFERRKNALAAFAKTGLPTTKNEDWKYTNILPILKKEYSLESETNLSSSDLNDIFYPELLANNLVFINGIFSIQHSQIIDNFSGIEIKSINEGNIELIDHYFGNHEVVADPFTSLNLAYATEGAFIKIPANKILQHPIAIYNIIDAQHQNVFTQLRNLVIAESNSEFQILESFHTIGSHTGFSNTVTQIFLKENSHVHYYKIQNDSSNSFHVGSTEVVHEAKSFFSGTTITFNGALVRNNLNILLNASYCETFMNGLYFVDKNMHVDNHTFVNHATPNCYSNELYKGVISGQATGVFNGKILVKKDAQKTNAFQSNRNILLSRECTMNTKPQLEIFADDVKCSHGATVGQLEEEPLFYLRSRGLSEQSAKALLTLAFADEVLERIKIDPLKEQMKKVLSEKFNKI